MREPKAEAAGAHSCLPIWLLQQQNAGNRDSRVGCSLRWVDQLPRRPQPQPRKIEEAELNC